MAESRFRLYLLSAAAMLALPAVSARLPAVPDAAGQQEAAAQQPAQSAACYRVYRTETGDVETLSLRDYLIGAVGAEMPASYEPEALKAQTVAVHTYAERIRAQNAAHPDPALHGADFSDDSTHYLAFYSEEQLRKFYGDAFAESYEKIAGAVDAVSDEQLYYADEPIVAAFHAVSAGQTEASENVWGTELPYLRSVSSEGDTGAPEYETVRCIQPDMLREAVQAVRPGAEFSGAPETWFGAPDVSAAGTVLHIRCGSEELSGQELRDALCLRSACFTVSYDGQQFVFTVKGFGHSVGMSQYGANVMAKNGSTCDEILAHYYPGAEPVHLTAE